MPPLAELLTGAVLFSVGVALTRRNTTYGTIALIAALGIFAHGLHRFSASVSEAEPPGCAPVAPEVEPDGVRLPIVSTQAAEASEEPRVTLTLGRDGEIRVIPLEQAFGDARLAQALGLSKEPKAVSLDALGRFLHMAKMLHHRLQRDKGSSGYVDDEQTCSRIRAVLRIDREAPVLHVAWIMVICLEQKFVRFAVRARNRGGGYVDLPFRTPAEEPDWSGPPPVVALGERDGKRTYFLDRHELSSVEGLADRLRGKHPPAFAKSMAFEDTVALWLRLRDFGLDVFPVLPSIPGADLRNELRLPRPE